MTVICEHEHAFAPPTWEGHEWFSQHEGTSRPRGQLGASKSQTADLLEALTGDVVSTWQRAVSFEILAKEVLLIKRRVRDLEQGAALTVPVESLDPEPFEVLKPFQVIVRGQDESYIATFFDANLSASGNTYEEAVLNLKDVIVAAYEALREYEKQLGPGPAKQLAVLSEFVRART